MRFLLYGGRKLRIPPLSPLLSREKKVTRFPLHGGESWGIPHFLHSCLEKESDEVSASWRRKLRNPPLSPLLSREKKAMRFLLNGGESWGIPHFLHSCLEKRKRWGFWFMGEKAEDFHTFFTLSKRKWFYFTKKECLEKKKDKDFLLKQSQLQPPFPHSYSFCSMYRR